MNRKWIQLSLAAGLLVGGLAQAADMPARKSGLWEMDNRMEGMPSHGPMQICIDQNADNMIEQRGRPGERTKPDCSVIDVARDASGRTRIHSICKVDPKTTATTDAVVSGDFAKAYRSEMAVRYAPPLEGMVEMHMVSQGKWLGPCKPGQRHGDVTIPGGQRMPREMMSDPHVRELMKRQGRAD